MHHLLLEVEEHDHISCEWKIIIITFDILKTVKIQKIQSHGLCLLKNYSHMACLSTIEPYKYKFINQKYVIRLKRIYQYSY